MCQLIFSFGVGAEVVAWQPLRLVPAGQCGELSLQPEKLSPVHGNADAGSQEAAFKGSNPIPQNLYLKQQRDFFRRWHSSHAT